MPNAHLQTQCKVMISSIETFKAGALHACTMDDGKISKSEKKYIKSLNKKLDNLVSFLNATP